MSNLFELGYLDPPWRFKNWSIGEYAKYGEKWARRNGRSPYPVMSTPDICKMPVGDLMAKNSLLLLWATSPKMEDAFAVIKAYGFEFVNVLFTWVKLNPSGVGWHFGLGYHTHQNAEFILLGKRGKGLSRAARDISSLIIYPRGKHSAKPPTARERIERLYGDVPRIEIFARQPLANWETWGNECPQSPYASILDDYIIPPIQAIIDEDEYQGLPVVDTIQAHYSHGEQMPLLRVA